MNKICDSITNFLYFFDIHNIYCKEHTIFIVKNQETRHTFELYFTMNL